MLRRELRSTTGQETAAASFRSLWVDNTAGPPRHGPLLASRLPAQLRSAPAGSGPAPPRLRPRRCSLVARARGAPGRAAGAADRRLCASFQGRTQGPQAPASAADSRLRQRGKTQRKKGEKENDTRAEGEKLYFFSYSFLGLK